TMTPTKSSVNPNRTSAGSIARTRISAWIVVNAVAIASSANAADVDSRAPLPVFSCPGRNKSRFAENAYTRLPPYAPSRISAAQRRPGPARELLGAQANHAGERHQRNRRGQEQPRRFGRSCGEHPRDGHGDGQDVQPVFSEREEHQSPCSSTSSSVAPGRRSKNASRLRSSERRSCGMVPSNV